MRYAEHIGETPHRSFFRRALEKKAGHLISEADPVHEYLIDQANLRGFLGAFSGRTALGEVDEELTLEEIVVGFLQPHSPVEPRILKLVVRILQSDRVDPQRLHFLARRERALPVLAWVVSLVPETERTPSIVELQRSLVLRAPRNQRRPQIEYARNRLLRTKGRP